MHKCDYDDIMLSKNLILCIVVTNHVVKECRCSSQNKV